MTRGARYVSTMQDNSGCFVFHSRHACMGGKTIMHHCAFDTKTRARFLTCARAFDTLYGVSGTRSCS